MTQLSLSLHPETPRLCGTCVNLNAFPEDSKGCCSRLGERAKTAVACGEWFGLEELGRPLYGRAKAVKRALGHPGAQGQGEAA